MPGGVVELFVIVAQVFVIEQPFDRGTPEERTKAHLRGAVGDHFANVFRNLGRHREAGVLETIRARGEPAPDFLRPMRVRDDGQLSRVRFAHDGLDFIHRHEVLID